MLLIILHMEETNKKQNSSFLDKFRGRTNKINKNGPNQLLTSDHPPLFSDSKDQNTKVRPKKLASLEHRDLSQDYSDKKSNKQYMTPGDSVRKQLYPGLAKRSTDVSIRSHKLEPINMPISSPLKEIKQSIVDMAPIIPPSRSITNRSETYRHRGFGKYLKLDGDAMQHFQFLLQIDKKRSQRKESAFLSEH